MDEPDPKLATPTHSGTTPEKTQAATPGARALELAFARGSGHINDVPATPERRTEHSVMEGLPEAKIERIASIYRELAELQRQLITSQQRIATEIQGRAEDAERLEALEARLQAQEQDATRVAALDAEIAGVRSQLASASATAEELRRDIATRDAQIEAAHRQHQDATQQVEVHSSSLRDAKTLLETRDAELATRTSERDSELATKVQLERQLEDARRQHGEVSASRDAELAATMTERDAVKGELEKLRAELETGRAKAREVASQLVRFGQELDSAGIALPQVERPQRPQPPPPPTRPSGQIASQKVETILTVTEEKPPTRLRSGLLMLGGVILGCAVTFAIVKTGEPSSNAAGYQADLGASSARASEPVAAPVMRESSAEPTAASEQPAPVANTDVDVQPNDELAQRADKTTDGVIVLPDAAAGHRVFVDDRVVEVKSSKAVVPCGAREVRIGSRGTPRTINVACGSETVIPASAGDR